MTIQHDPPAGQQRSGTGAACSSLRAAPPISPGPEPASTSLDREETSIDFDFQSYRDFMISGVRGYYERIERAYQRYDRRHGTKRTQALQTCKTNAWFVRHRETHEVRVASQSCRVRWCPLCERAAKLTVTAQIAGRIKAMKRLRFLTLTLKHTSAPLADQLDYLMQSFRKLRQSKYFKARTHGGIWFLQLTHPDSGWHPHIHCLLDGNYLEHPVIKRLWARITKGSTIVDIRAVREPEAAAEYVARYAQQPADPRALTDPELDEAMDAMNGRHTKGSWGTLKGTPLTPQSQADADDWELLGSWWHIAPYYTTSPRAKQIVDAWFDGKPLPPSPAATGPPAAAPTPTFDPMLWDFYPAFSD